MTIPWRVKNFASDRKEKVKKDIDDTKKQYQNAREKFVTSKN